MVAVTWLHLLAPKQCNREMMIAELHNILEIPINKPTIDLTLKTIRQPASNNNNQEVSCPSLCITLTRYQKGELVKKTLCSIHSRF